MAYKLTTLELRDGVFKPLLLDGAMQNSPWTAIYNCLQLKFHSLLPGEDIGDHLTEQDLKNYLLIRLKQALARAKSSQNDQEVIDHAESMEEELFNLVASHSHDVQLDIAPALDSTTTFGLALAYWIFQYLSVGLLHGWVIHPDDESKVQGALTAEDLHLVLAYGNVSTVDRSLIESLLNAEELTSYGFSCLNQDVEEDHFGIFYQKGGYSVIHKHKRSLLLLETNREFLERYPQARWKVFEEGNEENIYLTGRYLPANDQPNVERAKQWYRKNFAAETSCSKEQAQKIEDIVESSSSKEETRKDGATGSSSSKEQAQQDGDIGRNYKKPSRRQRRRAAEKARKAQATSQEESQGKTVSGPPGPASLEENKCKMQATEIVDNGGETQDAVPYSQDIADQPAVPESTAEPDITGWVDEREEAGIKEAEVPSLEEDKKSSTSGAERRKATEKTRKAQTTSHEEAEGETVSDNPPAPASLEEKSCKKLATEIVDNGGDKQDAVPDSHEIADQPATPKSTAEPKIEEDINPSTARAQFLKFLLEFQDGSSRLNEHGELVPYFNGVAEGMKATGSFKLMCPISSSRTTTKNWQY